ncbi:YeiH family protein [Aliagarivorans taiwanensis]|uniref:YeiH family protein n=1 Tax=Aliagarivorans taiwanensis TaxID=561966 RepID=UPI00041FE996|nr:putative sulfate exporter family transporter [Aliagarivorans taiwanensis]
MKQKVVFVAAALLCLFPFISSASALVMGFSLATLGLVPANLELTRWTKKLLAYSIVGLGFGINVQQALAVTSDGLGLIVTSIVATLALGMGLARLLNLEITTSYLISAGTAICGGSAIAAVAPAIKAKDQQIAMALATVFMLNSVALFVFPVIGHALQLDQTTFGTWAAIAIHDTSSVVGAASAYGEQALITATTLKLSRALWIVPVALVSALLFRSGSRKIVIPYFILFYCAAILLSDTLPQFQLAYDWVFSLAKQALVLCLFLIGSSISLEKVKASGAKALVFGVILWLAISSATLAWLLLA